VHAYTEIETKIALEKEKSNFILNRLAEFHLLQEKTFEDNYCFDYENLTLSKKGFLLRLRITLAHSILTLKGPSNRKGGVKYRKEIELKLDNGKKMLLILKKIGLKVIFRYQKYRTIYAHNAVKICFDETPIGNFLELEGDRNKIIKVANDLGFSDKSFIPYSYYRLFCKYKRENGLKGRSMIFKQN
jgi:adenylate cyclase class 2